MIAKRWLSRSHRLKWEYFFSEPNGQPTSVLLGLITDNPSWTFTDIVLSIMPYYVKYPFTEEDDEFFPPDTWFRANVKGPWTFWSFQHVDPTQEKYGNFYCFARKQDAMLFKLRWIS